jgi:hypothetical protein
MVELRESELGATTEAELTDCIGTRERELAELESRRLEAIAAVQAAIDPARRRELKALASRLGEACNDLRTIVSRLRLARSQARADLELVRRGGVPLGPLFPAVAGEGPRRRVRRGHGF